MKTFSDLPLRIQKPARTRVALVEALLERLAERTLEQIPVSELAKAAGISQATFFNYFGTKGDLLTHFIQLWSLRVGIVTREVEAEHASALAAIEALFVTTAEMTAATPRVMLEVIAHQARMPADLQVDPIDDAERLHYLDDDPDALTLPDRGLGAHLPRLLGRAVAQGELPASTHVDELTLAVASVFFGVPLLLSASQPDAIAILYRRQLQLIWAGARAAEVT